MNNEIKKPKDQKCDCCSKFNKNTNTREEQIGQLLESLIAQYNLNTDGEWVDEFYPSMYNHIELEYQIMSCEIDNLKRRFKSLLFVSQNMNKSKFAIGLDANASFFQELKRRYKKDVEKELDDLCEEYKKQYIKLMQFKAIVNDKEIADCTTEQIRDSFFKTGLDKISFKKEK